MSQALGSAQRGDTTVTVLVADPATPAGAVASLILGVPGVEVVILYPPRGR
jgi:hypothetical protein